MLTGTDCQLHALIHFTLQILQQKKPLAAYPYWMITVCHVYLCALDRKNLR